MTVGDEHGNPQLAQALGHPLRVRILRAVLDSPTSRHQLSKRLATPETKVTYHLGVLVEHGLVEGISAPPPGQKRVRYYRAKGSVLPAEQILPNAPTAVQEELARESFRTLVDRGTAALAAGRFRQRDGSEIAARSIVVDELGWEELRRIFDEAEARIRKVRQEAAARRKGGMAIKALVALVLFQGNSVDPA